ncbi:MAG: PEP/pyruvate-binding domain-containing protein [Desulfobaccales bacterium]
MSTRPHPAGSPWRWLSRLLPAGRARAALAETYLNFQRLLAANNRALSLMADLEEKLSGDFLFDLQYIVATVAHLRQEIAAMAAALNRMASERYAALGPALERAMTAVEAELHPRREIPVTPLVLFFPQVDSGLTAVVGAQNATLAEAGNRLGLPVPHGFAISTYAHKVFLEHHRLLERLTAKLQQEDPKDLEGLERLSGEFQEMIRRAPVPPSLEKSLHEACAQLADLEGRPTLLAIRPSPPGEDFSLSDFHQYPTFLNIPAANLPAHFRDLVASGMSPRALFYFKNKGFKEEEAALGVTVMTMVRPAVSGVLFTHAPEQAAAEAALIQAVWGVGRFSSGRLVNADQYLVARQPPVKILSQVIARQEYMLVCRPDAGLEEVPVHPREVEAPCLNAPLIHKLRDWAELLESHFGKPQDVSWVVDYDGNLWFLQSRPLPLPYKARVETRPRTLKQYPVLLDQGTVACRGVGAGPVVALGKDEDLEHFPPGGVLVLKHTSPRYGPIIPRAAAIVADHGSLTGHMALMARQYRIPTILNAGNATRVLKPGQEVTVDANYNNVYAGIIPELLEQPRPAGADLAETPVFQILQAVIQQVVPLNLLDPRDPAFTPEHCRTLHDLARYAHEMAMREMFRLTESEFQGGWAWLDLETDPPLSVRVLDLGGGARLGWRRRLRPAQIDSSPFRAYWQGLKSLTGAEPAAEAAFPEQSYALLSRDYLNLHLNLGNLLITVEAYLTDEVNDNYLTLQFRGSGPAGEAQETLSRFVETVLDRLDFHHRRQGDLIRARLAKYPQAGMAQRLQELGRLTQYCQRLTGTDLSEALLDWYVHDFWGGEYPKQG